MCEWGVSMHAQTTACQPDVFFYFSSRTPVTDSKDGFENLGGRGF